MEDFSDSVDITSDTFVELGRVTVDAKGASDVALTAHGYLEKPASETLRYEMIIARDGCDGEVVGATFHRPPDTTGMGFSAFTVSLTGFDTGISGSVRLRLLRRTIRGWTGRQHRPKGADRHLVAAALIT